jgi:hypothetical protein
MPSSCGPGDDRQTVGDDRQTAGDDSWRVAGRKAGARRSWRAGQAQGLCPYAARLG